MIVAVKALALPSSPTVENGKHDVLAHSLARKVNIHIALVAACCLASFLLTCNHLAGAVITRSNTVSSTSRLDDGNGTAISRQNNASNISNTADIQYEPSTFWSSLDLNGEINCGEYKCLFRQNLSENEDEHNTMKVGYLVGSNYRGYQFEAETQMSWKLAKYLKSEFGIKHLLLDDPGKVIVPSSALDIFQNQTYRNKGRHSREQMYSSGEYAVVQKVQIAPDTNTIIVMLRMWTKLKWLYREKATNKTSFISTFKKDIESTLNMLMAVPLLSLDFQIMIDSHGNVYQFDLDRVFLGRVYYQKFNEKLPVVYDKTIELLLKMLHWATDGQEQNSRDDYQISGKAVLNNYMNDTSSLSCEALDAVQSMSGRIGDVYAKDMARSAKLMMVHLVQMVMFDTTSYNNGRPKDEDDAMWNCSVS